MRVDNQPFINLYQLHQPCSKFGSAGYTKKNSPSFNGNALELGLFFLG